MDSTSSSTGISAAIAVIVPVIAALTFAYKLNKDYGTKKAGRVDTTRALVAKYRQTIYDFLLYFEDVPAINQTQAFVDQRRATHLFRMTNEVCDGLRECAAQYRAKALDKEDLFREVAYPIVAAWSVYEGAFRTPASAYRPSLDIVRKLSQESYEYLQRNNPGLFKAFPALANLSF
jgi:hypothetical protein